MVAVGLWWVYLSTCSRSILMVVGPLVTNIEFIGDLPLPAFSGVNGERVLWQSSPIAREAAPFDTWQDIQQTLRQSYADFWKNSFWSKDKIAAWRICRPYR